MLSCVQELILFHSFINLKSLAIIKNNVILCSHFRFLCSFYQKVTVCTGYYKFAFISIYILLNFFLFYNPLLAFAYVSFILEFR